MKIVMGAATHVTLAMTNGTLYSLIFRCECCVLHTGEQNSRLFPLVLTKIPFPQFLHVAGTQPYR